MADDRKLLFVLLSVGGLGGFIFGYTTGVIAGALPAMEAEFPSLAESSIEQGIFTAAILLGALIGAAYATSIAKVFNKRRTLFLTGLVTAIGSLLCAFLPTLGLILLGRELVGVAVGVVSVICPVYVSELAPKQYSGALGSWFQVALTFGILISYLSNLIFANVIYNFRWMYGVAFIPGALLCALYFLMPMAPSDINANYRRSVQKYADKDKPTGMKMYVEIVKTQKWGIFLSIILASTLQFTGINAVLYYAPTIFANAGFSGATASLLASLGVGAWNFLSTFVAIFLVDRVGRRPLLLGGLAMMMVSVVILGFVFQFLIAVSETASGILSIVFLFTYIMGFEAGIGSLFWPLLTETFDEQYRSAGASMGNVLQWSFNILLSTTFPFLITFFSQGIVFWGFGIVSFFCLVFLFFKLPETKQTPQDTLDLMDSTVDIATFSE